MTARERRQVVRKVQAARGISERMAVRFRGFPRSTMRYQSTWEPQGALLARIRELALQRPRWGYRRIHILLLREGWTVNRKRVQRLYRADPPLLGQALDFIESQEPTLDMGNRVLILDGDGEVEPIDIP